MNLEESERFSQQIVVALKSARLAAGISKYELAKRSGISQTMIYRLEKGDRNPTILTAHALAKALGKNFGEIVKMATSGE